jgi:hypothetical protein
MLNELLQENNGSGLVHMLDHHGISLIARFDGQNAYLAASEYAAWKRSEDQLTDLRAVLYSLQAP